MNTFETIIHWTLMAIIGAASFACSDEEGGGFTANGSDGGADKETDADTSTGGGADTGADGDSDSDSDSDTDSDSDADSDPDAYACSVTTMPTGGTPHSGNSSGGSGNLAWQIWSNVGTGNMTTFDVPAFSASWNNSGDYLGRLGYEWGGWGQTPRPYEEYGTITAEFSYTRTGTAGGYSYVGIYGWSTNPCVEWYIVDDAYNGVPFNPGNTTNKGEVEIDGGTYIMYTRQTTGTGGTRCTGATSWAQYYSMRKTARHCGKISITEHFDAWKSLGMPLGDLLEAKILIETGGGTGSVDFPLAKVTATNP